MKFVKLHQGERELVLNLSMVAEINPVRESNKSDLYMNFTIDNDQVWFRVDESLDEILEMAEEDVQYENDAVV